MRRTLLSAALGLLLVAGIFHRYWLTWMGAFLMVQEGPEKADAVLVLAGDYTGGRLKKGADLVKEGYVPVAWVSGPFAMYGRNEADLAVDFMISKGYPAGYFRKWTHQSDSTREELTAFCRQAQAAGLKRVLLVTSNFHTRRSARTARKVCPEVAARMVAAPYQEMTAENWWKERPYRKIIFMEWTKTVAEWLGI